MTTNILICDDSKLARKQMAASLPANWDIELSFAENGEEALEYIKQGKAELLFLDLNMPVMDGYETLENISKADLPCMTIVVSGDIQPEARARVKKLGAIDFIKKPVDDEKLSGLLDTYGLYRPDESGQTAVTTRSLESVSNIGHREYMQEVANVAMGQAADLLARLLGAFVKLPIPNVNIIEISELEMALSLTQHETSFSAVCQGFIGSGISGETLLIFNDSCFRDMANLLKYEGELDHTAELELIMEVASILNGACVNGIAQQLDVSFSQGHPIVLGQHVNASELVKSSANRWKQTLAVEISYEIENYNINCDLLLLFTEDSLDNIYERIDYILN